MDNIGPAVLYFTAQNGQQVTVHPTYSLAPGNLIKMNYIPNVVTYQKGTHRVYLVDPVLYKWLKKDSWAHEFQMESYTDAEKNAIEAVLKSPQSSVFRHGFPNRPAVSVIHIPHGGPAPTGKSNSTIPGTATTQTQPVGSDIRVTFTETWNNGKAFHSWSYTVNPHGTIVNQVQTGVTAPQDWQ